MSDIVERLRTLRQDYEEGRWRQYDVVLGISKEAADTIEQLQAQVEALQNKCAQRGLSPEDSDRLQARNDKLEAALREITGAEIMTAAEDVAAKAVNHDAMIATAKQALAALEE